MKNKNKVKVYANIGLLLVALIWGSGFVVSKILLDYIGPYYLLFYRFLISFLVMALIFSGKFSLINKENFKAGLVLGVLMFGGFMTQMVGLEFMDAGKQGFITASNVVMVPFIFWGISKVKPDAYDIIGALMCFLGMAFLSLEGSVASLGRGEILTLCSAVFFAFHVSFIGFYAKDHDPILLTLYQMFFSCILALIFAIFKEGQISLIPKPAILPVIYLGLFNTFVAFTLQNVSQKYTSSTNAAIILSLEAVFSMVLAVIVLKEAVTFRQMIGFTLVLLAVMISQTKLSFLNKKKKKSESKKDYEMDLNLNVEYKKGS